MQPQQVDIQTPLQFGTRVPDRLPPLERAHPPRQRPEPAPAAENEPAGGGRRFDVPVLTSGPQAAITVRYELDQVIGTWVAHVFDAQTGDLIREVPATEYHRQVAVLAALRQRSVDTVA